MPDNEAERVGLAASFVSQRSGVRATVGVVLGSGLGAFAAELEHAAPIPYAEIPGMPEPNVLGHSGNLWTGALAGVNVVCLEGRAHFYEGHTFSRVVFGVRMLAALGCTVVLLTNAAGGIQASFQPGDLMLITDHLNLMGDNPLRGPTFGHGPRFPDMSQAYDAELQQAARAAASAASVTLHEGVYAAMLGPSYETPAEIRMLRALGAAAVGMSTVPEVIALRQLGVRVGAMSCISNLAAGLSSRPLSHDDVRATVQGGRSAFQQVLSRWVALAGASVT